MYKMAGKFFKSYCTTVSSINEQLIVYKNDLEATDKDIYPVEELNAIVGTLCYVTKMKNLKACLETSEFKELFKQLKERIVSNTSRKFLIRKGCTKDDFYTIDIFTKLFNEMHDQLTSGKLKSGNKMKSYSPVEQDHKDELKSDELTSGKLKSDEHTSETGFNVKDEKFPKSNYSEPAMTLSHRRLRRSSSPRQPKQQSSTQGSGSVPKKRIKQE